MILIDDWRHCWARFWSVRLALLAAAASAVEAGVDVWLTGRPPVFAILAGAVSIGAAIARLIAQPNIGRRHKDIPEARLRHMQRKTDKSPPCSGLSD